MARRGERGGEVFPLKHSGHTWNATVLYAFNGTTDGTGPAAARADTLRPAIFGTTYVYNHTTDGTVYELDPRHIAPGMIDVLRERSREARNGCNPYAGLIADARGNLYGTTIECGPNGDGVAFEMVRAGKAYHERVLHTSADPATARRRTRG